MTKQKVWFEKKPEFRDECPFFVYGEHLHYCSLKEVNIFDNKDKCTYCPLQSIKTHDRELVKEVCEDLTKSILNLKYVNDTREFATYVLSIIKSKQKDFEK